MKIKKNDNIFVISGKDSGKKGVVQRVLTKENKIVVSGINIAKKHLKPSRKNPHGGILDVTVPINISNAMVICPNCLHPVRIGYKIKNSQKERICRKCSTSLDLKDKNVTS